MLTSPKLFKSSSTKANADFFSKQLNIEPHSKAQILEKLSLLFGLVYLENASNPIIAFLPQQFFKVDAISSASFSRTADFNYHENKHITCLEQFVEFQAKAQKSSHADQFTGGYIGFVDYDYAAQQHCSTQEKRHHQLYLGRYDTFLTLNHGQWFFNSHEENAAVIFVIISQLLADKSSDASTADIQLLATQALENILAKAKPSDDQDFQLITPCHARWTASEYQQAFEKIQKYILAGDCYQINLTQEFKAQAKGSLIQTADRFWQLTNAPYSAYLKLDEFEILSCSPELFIDFKSDGEIITKPIKGTMPRFADPIKDQASKQALIDSKKDQAENVMIVDLLRNDLSLYAETGTVKTTKLFDIESFNQVHHMVSEVRAKLQPGANPLAVLMSALPGGSITGAPKIRAMQIIQELEGSPRGAYCGSMGYFNYDATGSWNILIRTIQKNANDLSIWAGGGITIASECQAEYQECFDKVAALLALLDSYYQAN